MKRLIQPVALYVVLALGAIPAVTVACQWACLRQVAGQAHHHGEQQDSASHDAHHSALPTDQILTTAEYPCAHAGGFLSAISTLQFKIGALVGAQAGVALLASSLDRAVASATVATHSPPGARSAPLALRI